jgi:RNA polymerase-binding protein DksA
MADYLSDQQIRHFRQRLEAQLEALRREVREDVSGGDAQRFADLAGEVHDTEEESVASVLVDLEWAGIERQVAAANAAEAALVRLEQGIYGICVECDLPIPVARLEANPTAERCLACQTQFERLQALEQPLPAVPPTL